MKKTTLVIFISAMLVACGNNQKPKFVSQRDTTIVLGTYIDFSDSGLYDGKVGIISETRPRVDSFLNVDVIKDSFLFYLPKKDTTGRFHSTFKNAVCIGDLDSCYKKLLDLMKKIKFIDSTNKKPIK